MLSLVMRSDWKLFILLAGEVTTLLPKLLVMECAMVSVNLTLEQDINIA